MLTAAKEKEMIAAIKAQIKAKLGPYKELTPLSWGVVAPTPIEAVRTPKKRKAAKHEEDSLQAAVWKWFAYQYPEWAGHFWATPNGGARSKATAAILKSTGTLAGVADMQLAIVRPHAAGLFLELKVGKNKVSDAQRDFLARMKAQGYATAVAYDFHAAKAAIVNHIGY